MPTHDGHAELADALRGADLDALVAKVGAGRKVAETAGPFAE